MKLAIEGVAEMKSEEIRSSYRKKLRWDIVHSLSILSIICLTLVITLSVIFYVVLTSRTLIKEKDEIAKRYDDLAEHYTTSLEKISRYQAVKFLNQSGTEREMYAAYYQLIPRGDSIGETRLILTNEKFQAVFDSDSTKSNDIEFANYTRTVISNHAETVKPHVYLSQRKDHYLVLVKAVKDEKGKLLGYASCFIKGDALVPLTTDQIQYYIYDNFDNIFSMSTNYFVQGTLEKVNPVLFHRIVRYQGKLFFTDTKRLSDNLQVIVFHQETTLISILVFLVIGMLLFSLTTFLLIHRFAGRLAENSASQIETLTVQMNEIALGKTQRFDLQSGDEFEILSDRINDLLESLDRMHDNNIDLLRENIIAEKKKLEAQFNPHFLYNTLETIRIASYYDPSLVDEMVINLNEVLRYSISETTEYSRLADDLNYLRYYLRIFEIRFEAFNYTIQVEDELKNLYVPKLLLLPIVENSLKYGLMTRDDLTLAIECRLIENGNVSISVIDTGGGIPEKIIRSVNDSNQKTLGNHHGLLNSKRRFLLTYPHSKFILNSISQETAVIMEIKKEDFIHV
ncbi:sensor histidine kinase [Lactococcus piscium]|nr:histidine kinase [Lactococcus piscium]